MQWWCSAQGIPWDWAWRPYPGVWLFIGLLALGYWRAAAKLRAAAGDGAFRARAPWAPFALGLLALWLALDWPLGALGAGYLASAHMAQFLLIALVAPPLLISGLPRRVLPKLRAPPVPALLLFHAVVVATHWPEVVDGLMGSQLGSLAIDLAWLGGGLAFWWPVARPGPRFHPGARILYLIASTVLMTLPYVFLTFAELPFYATYELAPPVGTLSAAEDQRLAGLIMRLGAGAILWTAAGVVFWGWHRSETQAS